MGGGWRSMLIGVAAGTLLEALLGLPLSPIFASPMAGAVAGYLAGPPPHRGLLAGFLAAVAGTALLTAIVVLLGAALAGLPGALLAAAPAAGLAVVGFFTAAFAAAAGAAAAGLRATRSR